MLFCILYLAFNLSVVNAIHNVTVDDNDPTIIYQPPGSWDTSVMDVLDASGQHKVTSDPDATASFTFTGVGIYFYSPLWTFSVTTQVALDNLTPVLLDLRDYTQPYVDNGPETVQSSVVWSQTDLANTQHTLLVSVGEGQTLAILDALVYTVLDTGDVSSTTSIIPFSTSAPNSNIAYDKSSKKGLTVTLGVVCTVFGLLVISGIWWFMRRMQRRGDDDEGYNNNNNNNNYPRVINDDDDNIHSPEMSNTTTTTTTTTTLGNYSSHATYSRGGRDARFRSIPTSFPVVSNRHGSSSSSSSSSSRRAKASVSSTIRHLPDPPSKLKNALTTIPEAPPLREPSLVRHTSRSLVQDRRRGSTLSSLSNEKEDERGGGGGGGEGAQWPYTGNL